MILNCHPECCGVCKLVVHIVFVLDEKKQAVGGVRKGQQPCSAWAGKGWVWIAWNFGECTFQQNVQYPEPPLMLTEEMTLS